MFCGAGKIINSLPVDRISGKKRGLGFVRFKSEAEVLIGMEIADGRSWGGRKISAKFALPPPDRSVRPYTHSHDHKPTLTNNPWFSGRNPLLKEPAVEKRAGWILSNGSQPTVRAASWVVEEEKGMLN
eukprot:TRINITY_DN71919_c0_g1_i1.p1 TRINITY_DN71919_c0_g1~~TRINITY_DN71919_c0_g1_i1.p1  ORF type:complete len:128 (+),score=23.92 TRINITY_DN71919_c0_g1_i1:180-563(+)